MTLTGEQAQAIKDGEAVTVTPPEVGTACVLLRADMYERVRCLLDDSAEFRPRDAYPLIDAVMADDDADDPTLADYQQIRRPS